MFAPLLPPGDVPAPRALFWGSYLPLGPLGSTEILFPLLTTTLLFLPSLPGLLTHIDI
jgi:hypothetical protein